MRARIEAAFDRFARGVVRRRGMSIALCLGLAASLASQLPKMGIETAIDAMLMEDDPARIAYDQFREQFGREDLIILAIQPPAVFDLDFLRTLRRFHAEIESQVPFVDEVRSLVNARATYGSLDTLIVEDLLEEFPETSEALAALRDRVMSTPMYLNTVISKDATTTSIVVTMQLYAPDEGGGDALDGFEDSTEDGAQQRYLNGLELGSAVDALREVVERYQTDDFPIAMAGAPVLQQQLMDSMARNMQRFVALMIATIAAVLLLLFRRASGVLLPLLIVILALVSTMGALAASGVKLMPPTQVLPTLLLSVGTGAVVHILKIFYLRFDAGDSAEDAIAFAMSHSGLAVVMTSLTTAGGLLSFLAAPLAPILHLGIFAPLGILLALVYCLVLLPALLSLLPLRRKSQDGVARGQWLERGIVRGGDFSATHPWPMVGITVIVIAVSLTGAVRLEFSNDIMSWLAPDNPLRRATEEIDASLQGSMTLEIIADSGRENGVKQPAFLKGFEELRRRTERITRGDYLFVGKTISIADIVKEIHKALNENRPEFYAIPDDRQLVAQELLLFENTGTDDLEDVVDTPFRLARFTLKVPYVDPIRYAGFIEEVEAEFHDIFGDAVTVTTTGFMGMMAVTVRRVILGLARSYVLALAIITPLMILLIGNLRSGLVSMVPNLTPILLTLGLMGWFGISINMFTMMIGSIAIGLAVDDTIHFIHGFHRDLARLGDARAAVRETLQTTGQALLVTSIVLASGFLIFTFSEMENLFYFGLLTGFTIISAFIIDILVTPALMILVTPNAR